MLKKNTMKKKLKNIQKVYSDIVIATIPYIINAKFELVHTTNKQLTIC